MPVCIAAGFGLQILLTASRKSLAAIAIGLAVLWAACLAFMFLGGTEFAQVRPFIITRSLFHMVLGVDIPVDPLRFSPGRLADWRVAISPLAAALAIAIAMSSREARGQWTLAAVAVIALLEAAAIRISDRAVRAVRNSSVRTCAGCRGTSVGALRRIMALRRLAAVSYSRTE